MALRTHPVRPVERGAVKAQIVVFAVLNLSLSATAWGGDDVFWRAIQLLDHPVQYASAEKMIREASAKGLNVLLTAALVAGEDGSMAGAVGEMGCPVNLFSQIHSGRRLGKKRGTLLQNRIGRLIVRMLIQDQKLQQSRIRSPVSLEQRFAIVSLIDRPKQLLKVLESVDFAPDPSVSKTAKVVLLCLLQRASQPGQTLPPKLISALSRFEKKHASGFTPQREVQRCLNPSDLPDSVVSGLIGQNLFAARLVNAGYSSPIRIDLESERARTNPLLIEAAARQGVPGVDQAIDQAVFCAGKVERSTSLLGFLGDSGAADRAAAIAKRCPLARAAATTALIHLGDPRAVAYFQDAMRKPVHHKSELERAVVQRYTPAIGTIIKQMAARGDRDAKRLLQALGTAGKSLP